MLQTSWRRLKAQEEGPRLVKLVAIAPMIDDSVVALQQEEIPLNCVHVVKPVLVCMQE